jgi:uncharacterized membrane protein
MTESVSDKRRDALLAALLWYGTWGASALIAAGIGVSLFGPAALGHLIVKIGVALLIALPALQVFLLFVLFLRRRDVHYALIAALVLAILGTGLLIGMPA